MRAGRREAAARSPGGGARGFGGAEGAARGAAAPRAGCPAASGLGRGGEGGDEFCEGSREASGKKLGKALAHVSEAMRAGGSHVGSAVGQP